MKKVKIVIICISISVFLFFFGKVLWDGFFSHIFPWTKTNFSNYQEYIELLDDHLFYARCRFVKEIPEDATSVKYYCHQRYREKYAAHSIVLADEYEKIAGERISPYLEYCNDDPEMLIYELKEDRWGLDELKQAGAEVDFIQNVMQNTNEQQGYYCLVVIQIGTTHGMCYTGVILNDTTREVIEFSVELPDEYIQAREGQ